MKTQIKNLFVLPVLITGLGLIPTGPVSAQVFKTLHTFTGGSDGANPFAGLILSGSTLYGTAVFGGSSGYGTLFAINTIGAGFKVLVSFNGGNNEAYPISGLLWSGNTLYGAAGGSGFPLGALFAVNTNGTGFTTLHVFTSASGAHYTNGDGGEVAGTLHLSGNTLYGASDFGGSGGEGNVFAVNTNGTGFTTLHSFTATSVPRNPYGGTENPPYTNSDGAGPGSGVILSGNTLYGTTVFGGSSGNGTVFAVKTDGTGFTTLHSFAGRPNLSTGLISPGAGLVLSGNTLYGTTYSGGSGYGTVFSLSFRPQLTIIPSEANVILLWPTNYAGFDYSGYTLQSTTNLTSTVWSTNLQAPVVINGLYKVTNPISGAQQFFRLIQ